MTLYELEHPPHDTEEEFIQIMHLWETKREEWSILWREGLPKPKRRVGRPKATEGKQRFPLKLALGLTDEIVAGISAIRGELTVEECIRQILLHHLGPLANKKPISPG